MNQGKPIQVVIDGRIHDAVLLSEPGKTGKGQLAMPLDAPAPARAPWETAPSGEGGYNWRHDHALHAKLEWVKDNVPGPQHRSIQNLITAAVEQYVNGVIAQRYRPQ